MMTGTYWEIGIVCPQRNAKRRIRTGVCPWSFEWVNRFVSVGVTVRDEPINPIHVLPPPNQPYTALFGATMHARDRNAQ